MNQNQILYSGLQRPTLNGRFFCRLIWFSVIHWLSRAAFSLRLSIDVIDATSPQKCRSLIRIIDKQNQNPSPFHHWSQTVSENAPKLAWNMELRLSWQVWCMSAVKGSCLISTGALYVQMKQQSWPLKNNVLFQWIRRGFEPRESEFSSTTKDQGFELVNFWGDRSLNYLITVDHYNIFGG